MQLKRSYIKLSEEKRAQIRLGQEQVNEELPELAERLRMAAEAATETTFRRIATRRLRLLGVEEVRLIINGKRTNTFVGTKIGK